MKPKAGKFNLASGGPHWACALLVIKMMDPEADINFIMERLDLAKWLLSQGLDSSKICGMAQPEVQTALQAKKFYDEYVDKRP